MRFGKVAARTGKRPRRQEFRALSNRLPSPSARDGSKKVCILLREEEESRKTGLGVAPWYYEQLAIVYRKQGRHNDELAILKRYDRQIKAPGAKPATLMARLEKVRSRRQSQSANTADAEASSPRQLNPTKILSHPGCNLA
jgi:hypothetical protein